VLIAVAALALTADIVSKALVVARLEGHKSVELLGGLTTLRVTRNSGAAFSIGTGSTWIFTIIACAVVFAIIRTARNLRSLPWAICLGLLLGGAVGNLLDRLLRAPGSFQGHVVDWIEWPHWPVFNLADSAIVCGGVLAVILAGRGIQIDGGRAVSATQTTPEAAPEAASPVEPAPDPSTESKAAPTTAPKARDAGSDGE